MQRKYTLPRIRRAFEIYKALSASQAHAKMTRGTGFGIAVNYDDQAVKWQKLEFRLHVIDQWIRNDKINWFFARWLSVEEANRRNAKN